MFITGISTALCAYVGQTFQAQRFGFNAYTLEVISLGLVVFSIILSFARFQLNILVRRLNHDRLHMGEVRGASGVDNMNYMYSINANNGDMRMIAARCNW
jgi:hypothetical protein